VHKIDDARTERVISDIIRPSEAVVRSARISQKLDAAEFVKYGRFRREDFNRRRPDRGNKTTAIRRADGGCVAIFVAASTALLGGAIFTEALVRERLFRLAQKELATCKR
jgi:hypothetical protein